MSSRYELLPFGAAEDEVASAPRPLTITVTCSPRHGVDRTVDVATRIAALGHRAIPHIAARTIRDHRHLDDVLARLAATGLDDVFIVAGDSPEPAGPFPSAVDVLPRLAAHPSRPRRVGIAAYPEGHPLIDPGTLEDALDRKASMADYLVTQMCFDPQTLMRWIAATRVRGIGLPVYVGLPGDVDRRRLLEVSMRVGVGTSIAFLRKQRGIRQLLGRPHHAAEHLYEAFAPLVGDLHLNVAGLHYFTFNRLQATLDWEAALDARRLAGEDVAADA
jgi:methylenetetrahydrofolate reductase (NADPH)